MSGGGETVMALIHAEEQERELRRRAEARLTEKLLRVTEELLRAERELHELKLQRLHRRHWVKFKRLRESRDTLRQRLPVLEQGGGTAAELRKERDEAREERDRLGQILERVRRLAPNSVDTALGREPVSAPIPPPGVAVSYPEQE